MRVLAVIAIASGYAKFRFDVMHQSIAFKFYPYLSLRRGRFVGKYYWSFSPIVWTGSWIATAEEAVAALGEPSG